MYTNFIFNFSKFSLFAKEGFCSANRIIIQFLFLNKYHSLSSISLQLINCLREKRRQFLSLLSNTGLPLVLIMILPIYSVQAANLKNSLKVLIKTHKTMTAANADLEAAKEGVSTAKGEWFPTLDVTANIANDQRNKQTGTDDSNHVARNLEMSVTQKVWDFGSTNSAIRSAKLTLQQSLATRSAVSQNLFLEGITAHYNVIRAQKLLDFSEASAANIKKQSELEDARVQRGSGLSTDVLQAKTQLAGAEARVIQALGTLKTSKNRYKAIFGNLPIDPSTMREPRLPLSLLPTSLTEAIKIVFRGNPDLAVSRIGTAITGEAIRKTKADEFMPTFEASAANNIREDSGGSFGSTQEQVVKLEGKFSINLGLTAINTLRASKLNQLATTNRYRDLRDQTEEKTRNAWNNLETARDNALQLHNQANIAAEFLDLARKERKLGNRSLIEVLGGETALINASSDAASADTTLAIAIFTLLSIMGQIQPDILD